MDGTESEHLVLPGPLRVLTVKHIMAIDEALRSLGPYSEVRLIKNKGRLRFIQKVESESFGLPNDRT